MKNPFHAGELAVQAQVGEGHIARRNGRIITDRIPDGAITFVDRQPMVIASSLDADGQLWTSLLAGEPGFCRAENPSSISLNPERLVSARDDIFWTNIQRKPAVGLLFIELNSRRRLRVNGLLAADGQRCRLTVREAYALCPRYIQRREIQIIAPIGLPDAPTSAGTELTESLTDWIAQADTFFVGSAHDPDHIDASHRGGKPGFVRVEDGQTLLIPDYNGNSMFNTLGNLLINPAAGLLFVDFDGGRTLQLTGRAELLFGVSAPTDITGGTGRCWRFHLRTWRQQASLRNVGWTFVEYSPFNV